MATLVSIGEPRPLNLAVLQEKEETLLALLRDLGHDADAFTRECGLRHE